MASETLAIKEELLSDVVAVIRAGLIDTANDKPQPNSNRQTQARARRLLKEWCDEITEYLRQCEEDDE